MRVFQPTTTALALRDAGLTTSSDQTQHLFARRLPDYHFCGGYGSWVGRFCVWNENGQFDRAWFDLCWQRDTGQQPSTIFWPGWPNAVLAGLPIEGIHERLMEDGVLSFGRLPIGPGAGMQMRHLCPIGYKCMQMLDANYDAQIAYVFDHLTRSNEAMQSRLLHRGAIMEPIEGQVVPARPNYQAIEPSYLLIYMTDMYWRRFTRNWVLTGGRAMDQPYNQRPGEPLLMVADEHMVPWLDGARPGEPGSSRRSPGLLIVPAIQVQSRCPYFQDSAGTTQFLMGVFTAVLFWGNIIACFFLFGPGSRSKSGGSP